MLAAIKSEFRKLLTVRTTYFMILMAFLLTSGLIAFWIFGYQDVSKADTNANALLESVYNAVSIMGIFVSLITIMLVGHEYRYNTIMYSLTSVNRRSKLFFAKYLVSIVFSLIVAAILASLTIVAFNIGQSVHHINTTSQHSPVLQMIWHCAASIAANVTFSFILAIIIRSLIGAIVTILIVPSTIEGLLSILLKENVKYLPFTALSNLTSVSTKVSATMSLSLVAAYAAFFGLVSYILFLKRDAN